MDLTQQQKEKILRKGFKEWVANQRQMTFSEREYSFEAYCNAYDSATENAQEDTLRKVGEVLERMRRATVVDIHVLGAIASMEKEIIQKFALASDSSNGV